MCKISGKPAFLGILRFCFPAIASLAEINSRNFFTGLDVFYIDIRHCFSVSSSSPL